MGGLEALLAVLARRLRSLREWSHDGTEQILTRGRRLRTSGSNPPGPSRITKPSTNGGNLKGDNGLAEGSVLKCWRRADQPRDTGHDER